MQDIFPKDKLGSVKKYERHRLENEKVQMKAFVLPFKSKRRRIFFLFRASSYDPANRAGSVTGMNFVVCSYGKFQPGYRDEIQETKPKWRNINKYCSRLS